MSPKTEKWFSNFFVTDANREICEKLSENQVSNLGRLVSEVRSSGASEGRFYEDLRLLAARTKDLFPKVFDYVCRVSDDFSSSECRTYVRILMSLFDPYRFGEEKAGRFIKTCEKSRTGFELYATAETVLKAGE